MKRATLNRIIDTLAFAGFVLVTTTGVLLRYLLPPGSGGLHRIGLGFGAAKRPITLLWGLSRHDWGTVHFWIALGLMIVLTIHLILHWRWIKGSLRGQSRAGSGIRAGLGIVGLATLLALAAAPLLSPTAQAPRSPLSEPPGIGGQAPSVEQPPSSTRGMMTLQEVEDLTGVPVAYLLDHLGLPQTVSPDERLGRLRRTYGFTMQDVRRIVTDYRP